MSTDTPDLHGKRDLTTDSLSPKPVAVDDLRAQFWSGQTLSARQSDTTKTGTDLTLDTASLFRTTTDTSKVATTTHDFNPRVFSPTFLSDDYHKPEIDLASAFYSNDQQNYQPNHILATANLDVQNGVTTAVAGDSVETIAKKWLGAAANPQLSDAYVQEILQVNHLTDGRLQPGQELLLPGHTEDGGFVVQDKLGNTLISWLDGRESLARTDKRGHDRVPSADGGYDETHWGPRRLDNFELIKSAAGDVAVVEKGGDKPLKPLDDPKVAAERAHLMELAEKKIKDPEELAKFRADMARLEARAKEQNLPPEEIAKTYKEISRLLDDSKVSKWSLPMDQRVVLAEQVMAQAASPSTINQGGHETCNVTAVESRTYTLHPSNAAKLIADVALNGSYQSPEPKPHGTLVHINSKSLKPDDEASINPPRDGDRSFATQIFNVTAVNLVNKADHNGKVYVNDPDNGETTVDKRKHNTTVSHAPDINDDQIVKAYDMVNNSDRKSDPIVMIDAVGNVEGKGAQVEKVKSEQELMDKLLELKAKGKLPIILGVDANVEPFWTDSGHGAAGGSAGGHVVTVTDVDPGPPPKISVANQWGTKADHQGDKAIPLRDLFIAMHTPKNAEPLLQHDVEEDRKNGTVDPRKELELLRLHHFNKVGELKDDPQKLLDEYKDYSDKLAKQINQITDKWAADEKAGKPVDPEEKRRTKEKIGDLIDDPNLPPSGQLKILKLCRDKGLISENAYRDEVGTIMREMTGLKDNQPTTEAEKKNSYPYKEYTDSQPALKQLLKDMPEDERQAILDRALDDDQNSAQAKFALLREVHELGLISDQEFVARSGKAFKEFKHHQDAGDYDGSRSAQRDNDAGVEAGRKLLAELPPDVVAKIKAVSG